GNTDYPLMKNWLYHSLINGVFRSKGVGWIPYKTGVRKLLEVMKNYKNQDFPKDELSKVYIDHPITFTTKYSSDNLDQLDSSFVFYLMYDREKTIRTNDIDHVMPKNILEEKGFDWNLINSIKNFQLLDYGTNRGEKNGKPFKKWIDNQEYVKDKSNYLKIHLIPSDETLWEEDKFKEFIEERAKLIISKIDQYFK
ncbi:MAG: DUF1524 domain-containing protein, partial [Spirochaetota bacterium]